MSNQEQVPIELTPEQKDEIGQASDQNATPVKLTVEELEERIAPGSLMGACSTGSHLPTTSQ